MSSLENIIIVVIREKGRLPARIGCVAGQTFQRKVQRSMVWIAGLVEITGMATTAGVRGCVVIAVVATGTII